MSMTRNEMNVRLAAILTTLAEPGLDGAAESMLYLGACGGNMDDWSQVRMILLAANLVEITPSHQVFITETGRAMAKKVEAARKGA